MSELKVSQKLEEKLNENDLKDTVYGIINFKETVEEMLKEDKLTPTQRERIAGVMEKLTSACEKIEKITQKHISNDKKIDQIKKETGIAVPIMIDALTKEIQATNEIVDEKKKSLIKSLVEKTKSIVDKLKNHVQDSIKEKEEENREMMEEDKKDNKALTLQDKKSDGFFKRLWKALRENPNTWEINRTDEGIIELTTKEGRVMDVIPLDEGSKAADEKVQEAKKNFGFFARMKFAFGKGSDGYEERMEKKAERVAARQTRIEENKRKIDKLKKQIKDLGDLAAKNLNDAKGYAEERIEGIKNSAVKTIETLKDRVKQIKEGIKTGWENAKDTVASKYHELRAEDYEEDEEKLKEQIADLNDKLEVVQKKKGRHTTAKNAAEKRRTARTTARTTGKEEAMEH